MNKLLSINEKEEIKILSQCEDDGMIRVGIENEPKLEEVREMNLFSLKNEIHSDDDSEDDEEENEKNEKNDYSEFYRW